MTAEGEFSSIEFSFFVPNWLLFVILIDHIFWYQKTLTEENTRQ